MTYELTANITAPEGATWTAKASFVGILDGKGFMITLPDGQGLINTLDGATVKNLGISANVTNGSILANNFKNNPVISNSYVDKKAVNSRLLTNVSSIPQHIAVNSLTIPMRIAENEKLSARASAPDVHILGSGCTSAMIIVFYTAQSIQLRQESTVTEGIRGEIQVKRSGINTPMLLQVLLGIENMVQYGLGAGHILVRLYPGRGGDLPAAFPDAFLNFGHQLRGEVLNKLIGGSLGLGETKLGVFLHQLQHGFEGSDYGSHGLIPTPHPVHIQVGVAYHQ
jgi:hypothetical protein